MANGLATIALTWTPDALYMAGFNIKENDNFLYRLPPDGSCAQLSCMSVPPASWPSELPSHEVVRGSPVAPSVLAAGVIGTTPVVAVGLTNSLNSDLPGMSGVIVFNQAAGTLMGSWQPVGTNGGALQTAVTALDWDDSGSGLLAIGTIQEITGGVRMQAVRVAVNGPSVSFAGATNFEPVVGATVPAPLSTAVGHRVNGSAVVAFGMDDGTVKLWDPRRPRPPCCRRRPDRRRPRWTR